MFSSVGNTTSRHGQGSFGKGYSPSIPKGFTVRVFKGPTLSSFPHTATAKFDLGYHPFPLADPPQNQNWYPSNSRLQNISKPPSAPSEPPKSSRSRTAESVTTTSVGRGYEANARAAMPSYSIYQSSKETYIYEPSLSSKSDLFSNSEYDGASTTTFSPSSAFSPAMSTDSITTLKSPPSAYNSLTERDSRPSTPTPLTSRNSFIPGLSQAQSAIRGIFRSQTPYEPQSIRSDTAFAPHAPSIRPSASHQSPKDDARRRDTASSQVRSTTPIRVSVSSMSSGSGGRSIPHTASSYMVSSAEPHPTSSYTPSTVSESEDSELDRVARTNAQYNATSSASSLAYYSGRGGSAHAPASRSSTLSSTGEGPRPTYTTSPLRSSPEQQHVFPGGDAQYMEGSSYEPTNSNIPATETTHGTNDRYVFPSSSYHSASSVTGDNFQSEQFIPPLGEWIEDLESQQAQARRQSGALSSSPIPQFVNEGPPQSRYVPASRTMSFSSQAAPQNPASSLNSSRADGHSPPVLSAPITQSWTGQRERRSSAAQPPAMSFPPAPHGSHERNGGSLSSPTNISRERNGDVQISPVDQRTVSAAPPYATRVDVPTPNREHYYGDTMTTDRLSNLSNPPSSCITPSIRTSPTQEQQPSSAHPDMSTHRDHSPPTIFRDQPQLRSSPEQGRWIPPNIYATAREFPATSVLPPTRASPEQRQRTSSVSYPGRNLERPQTRENSILLTNVATISNSPPAQGVSVHEPSLPDLRNAQTSAAEPPVSMTFSRNQSQQQPDTRNSPRQNPVHTSTYDESQSHITAGLSGRGNRNEPSPSSVYPSWSSQLPAPSHSQNYTTSGTQRPFDSSTNGPRASVVPPSASSDPGQGQDYYRTSFVEPRRAVNTVSGHPHVPRVNEERASFTPLTVVNDRPEGAAPSRKFPEVRQPHPEPQRRHSDGDRSIGISNGMSFTAATQEGAGPAPTGPPEPQRRFSDGDQIQPNVSGNKSVALFRTVRWNDNLVCPSPIFSNQRRKGWYNRRGDQLWTNDGAYKPPPEGQEYPRDLDGYPEQGQGWMNEEGVRIDMGHRLIPKPPLRSALKQTRM